MEQIFALNEALLRQRRAGKTTYCFFIDFRKAFDTVWHAGLWQRLWDEGIRGKAWRILRSLYSNLESSVLVEGEASQFSTLEQGVRQGCPLSPALFNCYINDLVKRLKEKGYGVGVGNKDLTALLYADDIVVMADSAQKLQELINEVDSFCSKWWLQLNTDKSKVMVVESVPSNPNSGEPLSFRGQALENVTESKYVGVTITGKLLWDRHISTVKLKGLEALDRQRRLFAQRLLPMKIKRLVYTAMVRSKLEYASQIWTCNSKQERELESIQHKACAWILRANRKSSTEALRTILGLPSLRCRRDMLRLFFVGILLGKEPQTWPRHCFETKPSSSCRVKGRSQPHWVDLFSGLVRKSDDLEKAYKALQRHLQQCGGVLLHTYRLEDDGPLQTPVKDWRAQVRASMEAEALDEFRNAAERKSSLEVLNAATDACLQKPATLTKRASHPANWLRLRFLAGMSALNERQFWIPRGARGRDCPLCGEDSETIQHFLRTCRAQTSIDARSAHSMRMPDGFEELSTTGQCAFILGCQVPQPAGGEVAPTPEEDLHNRALVQALWDARCESFGSSESEEDLTLGQVRMSNCNSSGIVRRGPSGSAGIGVEAHGNYATLSK